MKGREIGTYIGRRNQSGYQRVWQKKTHLDTPGLWFAKEY